MLFLMKTNSSWARQCSITLASTLFPSITMASTIALNSVLVSSLQSDPDLKFSFEQTSWISELFQTVSHLNCIDMQRCSSCKFISFNDLCQTFLNIPQ